MSNKRHPNGVNANLKSHEMIMKDMESEQKRKDKKNIDSNMNQITADDYMQSPEQLENDDEMENNEGTYVVDPEQAELGEQGEEGVAAAYPHRNPQATRTVTTNPRGNSIKTNATPKIITSPDGDPQNDGVTADDLDGSGIMQNIMDEDPNFELQTNQQQNAQRSQKSLEPSNEVVINDQINSAQEDMQQTATPQIKVYRSDRYGVQIIPRAVCREKGIKSQHKLTFIDQVHQNNQNMQNSPSKGGSSKQQKRLITLESDKNRGIVNIFHRESFKRYNAMEIEDQSERNPFCKGCCVKGDCNIF